MINYNERQDFKFQEYYKDTFSCLDIVSDKEVLEIGTEFIKVARDLLNRDLEDKNIYYEYRQLDSVVYLLNNLLRYYK